MLQFSTQINHHSLPRHTTPFIPPRPNEVAMHTVLHMALHKPLQNSSRHILKLMIKSMAVQHPHSAKRLFNWRCAHYHMLNENR